MELPLSDPILIFTTLIGVILLAPLLADRLRVPDLVLILIAGAVLGPHGTGLLAHSAAISLFGAVGLLYIMFLAGLEIDLHRFASVRFRSVSFGLITFSIPQGIGTLTGYYLLGLSWPASILLASMFASHTLLAYPIASRLGLARREPVTVTVGATIITDTLALLVLAVIADSARGVLLGFRFWLGIGLGMAALVSLAWWGIPWLSRRFFSSVPEKGGAQFLFVIAVVCGCSYLSHYAKMEPIIGAFLAGVAFNRLIPEHSALMNRVEFAGHTLFIPFFLISVGMIVDPGALVRSPRSWLVAGTIVAAVVATKWLAAKLAGWLFGYRAEESSLMFGLSVVQAAATLAAVLVGYNLKIFDEIVLNGAVAMILVTCPLGSWVVERNGRRMASHDDERPVLPRAEQRLLVPVANPTSARRLLDMAFLLRDTALPGAIYPVTIVRDEGETGAAVAEGENLLAHCLTYAAAVDIPVNPGVRVGLNVSDGIVRAAKELRVDAVLIGWGGSRTAAGRIFGTVLENIMDDCPSRIVLCRVLQPLNTTRRLLLPLPPLADRREDIEAVLHDAKWLARQIGADLCVWLCEPSAAPGLRERIERAQPSVPLAIQEARDWREARSRLFEDIRADDLAMVLVERRRSTLWSPSQDRFSAILASRFPDNNLLAFYPPLTTYDEFSPPPAVQTPAAPLLVPVEGLSDVANLEEALRRMTGSIPAWTFGQRASVFSLLADSARTFPVEMAPGVVFVHAHSDAVRTTTLLVGRGTRAWLLPGGAPVRIVLALISPRGQSPEIHLKALSVLAQRFHGTALAERIHAAASAEEICRIIEGEYV